MRRATQHRIVSSAAAVWSAMLAAVGILQAAAFVASVLHDAKGLQMQ